MVYGYTQQGDQTNRRENNDLIIKNNIFLRRSYQLFSQINTRMQKVKI